RITSSYRFVALAGKTATLPRCSGVPQVMIRPHGKRRVWQVQRSSAYRARNIEGMIVMTTLQAHETHTTAQLSNDVTPVSLRSAFGQFPSGVAALAVSTDRGP